MLDGGQTRLLITKDESLIPPDIVALKKELAGVSPGRVAIAEIAGRDSIAAALAAMRAGEIDAVVPTCVYTGTEYGDWDLLVETTASLKARLEETGVRLASDLLLLGSPQLWAALNGRHMRRLIDAFGFFTPCVGCHLYVHLMRVPLAWELGCAKIVSGERESHDGRVKANQGREALDAYRRVLADAGVDLMLPIRAMASGAEVQGLIGRDWAEGDKQLRCVLSRNYEGGADWDAQALADFMERFIVPAGEAIIRAWRSRERVAYADVVGAVIDAMEPAP